MTYFHTNRMIVKHNLSKQNMADNTSASGATNPDEELELEITTDDIDDIDDIEVLRETAKEDKRLKGVFFARAKKAEGFVLVGDKWVKPAAKDTTKTETVQNHNNINQSLTADQVDIRILTTQGVPKDEIDMLQKIAALNGCTIIDAQSDPYFKNYKDTKEKQERQEKANLGPSKNGGTAKAEKTFNTPGLDKDSHKEMWRQSQG